MEADSAVPDQGVRGEEFEAALSRLAEQGLTYDCNCSRKKLQLLDFERDAEPGPQVLSRLEGLGGAELPEKPYPGCCRDRGFRGLLGEGVRLRLPAKEVRFEDLLRGSLCQTPALQCGDLLLRDRYGQWSYNFAVACDDLSQGVDLVIRGEDLLHATGRQMLLGELLGRTEPARFLHHPVLLDPETDRKLSKRERSAGIGALREAGWGPENVLSEAARQGGVLAPGEPDQELPELLARVAAALE